MTRWPSQLFLLLSVAAAFLSVLLLLPGPVRAMCGGPSDNVELYPAKAKEGTVPLVIGYMTAIKGELKDRQGRSISGALTMALDHINSNPNLLPNVTLQMRWNDTRGDTVSATRAMTDMICDGVVSFIGPEGPCHVEAIVSQSRNIPMISYRCSDYKASSIPTFARTEPPDTQVTKSVISLLLYYGWQKFTIIYEEPWATVANSLKVQAQKNNMTINHSEQTIDSHKCCEKNLPCCTAGYWFQLIQNTKNRTRIYVFLGSSTALVDIMSSMDTSNLFDKGEYMVIYVDMTTYSQRSASQYLWKTDQVTKMNSCVEDIDRMMNRARSLLVVVTSEPSENYTDFLDMVREYNERPPFHFTKPKLFMPYDIFISQYSAYLYDSAKLYAWALDKMLNEQTEELTPDLIRSVALDGIRLIDTIIQNRTYSSVTGATIKIDQNGDSEGNFSVVALKKFNYTLPNKTIPCTNYMVPVAYFHHGKDLPEYKIVSPTMRIDWPGQDKPADQPICGFHDELCPKEDTHLTSLIVACTLGLCLFCVGVVSLSIYRKWKIELEIEGLLWRIEPDEIKGFNFNLNKDIVASPSKLSLVSAASFGSRCSNQVFTTTGRYRGMVVRMKELKYARKKDISRDVMKEMRLLRDLRHDNINSFIGAVVEPTRTLLVTDYCAKGSLYDIVENEDIKLDEMFVASLVHDLIKGMIYIHDSALHFHGNLKSSNCVVTSRWMLQVSDFGLHDLRHCAESESIGEHQFYRNQFWKAPELLRDQRNFGSQKADVYAFAIILYEMIGRKGPFGQIALEPKEIVERVRSMYEQPAFRPDMDCIMDSNICADYIISCIRDSWDEIPEVRPDFPTIRQRLKRMRGGKSRNIMDQIMELMEKYANNLEDVVNERTRQLCEEKRKTEDLLHRMLPESVADRLTRGLGVEPVSFHSVTIYFSDIVGFTALSAVSSPLQVVNFLNDLYTLFDRVIKGYDVYKVETIGDAYMVVSGLPIANGERHVGEIASMSLDLLQAIHHHRIAHRPQEVLKLRVGMHTGPVVAGVVGLTMPRYCLFGDTVNTASRMESNGEALRIHISSQCKEALDRLGGYITEDRGLIELKGKGEVQTYWLVGATERAVQRRDVNLGDLPPLFLRPRYSPKQMTPESRQASIAGLQHFGSRRQSAVPASSCRTVEAMSMHSLQEATIPSRCDSPMRDCTSQRPNPNDRICNPLCMIGYDGTPSVAGDGIGTSDDDDEPLEPGQATANGGTGGEHAAQTALLRTALANNHQEVTDVIRKPLVIRPSVSMDMFPRTINQAQQPAPTASRPQTMACRLRRRVDSAISLVSPTRRQISVRQRNRSSRSLDASGSVSTATSNSRCEPNAKTVSLIDAVPPASVVAYRENGDASESLNGAAESTDLDMADMRTQPKPYLNNNCNGGSVAARAHSSGGSGATIVAIIPHSVRPNSSLMHRQSSLNGPLVPMMPNAHKTMAVAVPDEPIAYASNKRWHSLDQMADLYASAGHPQPAMLHDECGELLMDTAGSGKKPLPGGSIRSWLVGLLHGRSASAGQSGSTPVIVPAGGNHFGGGAAAADRSATPDSESLV